MLKFKNNHSWYRVYYLNEYCGWLGKTTLGEYVYCIDNVAFTPIELRQIADKLDELNEVIK